MASFPDFRPVAFGTRPIGTSDVHEISLRLLIACFFAGPILFVAIETSPTAWAAVAAICGAAAILSAPKPFDSSLKKPALILLGLSGFVALSTLWSIDPKRSLFATRDLLGYSVAALVLLQSLLIIPREACARVLKACLGGIAIALPILIGRELVMARFNVSDAAGLVQSITLHKITFYGLLFAIPLLALRTPASIAAAAAFALVTLAYGRTTGINLGIVIIAALYLMPENRRRHAFTAFVAVYAVLAILAPVLAPIIFGYLDRTGILTFYPGTFAARLEIWALISNHVWSDPLVGHGANTVRQATWLITNPKYYVDQDLPSAHNIVIDLWFELGIAGVALLCLAMSALARRINTLKGSAHFIAAAMFIAVAIELSVDHRIWLSWMLGTLIMAAAICVLSYRTAEPS